MNPMINGTNMVAMPMLGMRMKDTTALIISMANATITIGQAYLVHFPRSSSDMVSLRECVADT